MGCAASRTSKSQENSQSVAMCGRAFTCYVVTNDSQCSVQTTHDGLQQKVQHPAHDPLKQNNTQYSGHMGKKKGQNEVMGEICSKSLVRAIGKVFCMKIR